MSGLLKYGREDKDNNGAWYILDHTDVENANIDTLVFIPNDIDKSKVARISVAERNTGSPSRESPKNLSDGEDFFGLSLKERGERFFPNDLTHLTEVIDVEKEQNSVLVYPVIVQRTGGEYYQQLTKSSLEPNQPRGFERIDKQVLTAIDAVRDELFKGGIDSYPDVDMLGQSAAGTFSQRFALLHLDRVHLSYSNGAKDGITLPIESIENPNTHENVMLPYPLGIADIYEYYKDDNGKYVFDGKEYNEPQDFMRAYKERLKEVPFLATYGEKEDKENPHHIHSDKSRKIKLLDHPTNSDWVIVEAKEDPIVDGCIVIGDEAAAFQVKKNVSPEKATSIDELIPISTYDMTFIRSITPAKEAMIMRDCIGETQADRINRTRDIWSENGMQMTIQGIESAGHGMNRDTINVAAKFIDDVAYSTELSDLNRFKIEKEKILARELQKAKSKEVSKDVFDRSI